MFTVHAYVLSVNRLHMHDSNVCTNAKCLHENVKHDVIVANCIRP